LNNFIRLLFYGNLFYGICSVALSIESNLQHKVSLNSYRFYVLVFLATVIYYGRIYYKSSVANIDDRTKWYRANKPAIRKALIILSLILIADVFYIAYINRSFLLDMPLYYWLLLGIIPLLGVMYTSKIFPLRKLRRVGWLKPFIIGFVWAGVVTIFPVLFWEIRHPFEAAPGFVTKLLLWLQNFLFITSLAIIFDIKDQKADQRLNLDTYPAKFGIKNTIRYSVIPLAFLSFTVLVTLHIQFQYSGTRFIAQSIPYLLLIIISTSLNKERNLLFYLAAVDGLMLIKAVCGIVSVSFF
jgi:4-hydroxybenzoate polyprenyltransferase